MKHVSIGPISVELPPLAEENDFLADEFPSWNMDLIYQKTGVRKRHIAAPDQCSSDLGVAAAEKLFAEYQIDRDSIDFLLFCTQTPDYPLPTTACLMQDRLGLRTSIGAIDYNLGCSGFVYGLAMAGGLIRSETARRVLVITAETYSKFIHPTDRSLRTIFGDGAAAAIVELSDEPSIGPFVFGTDGRGADTLMVTEGGARKEQILKPRKRKRWPSELYMDGPGLVKFTLEVVPPMVEEILAQSNLKQDDIDLFLMHQATAFMLDHLRDRLTLDAERLPQDLEEYGNTVSSTIPILINDLRESGQLRPGKRCLLIGYGVGLSWAGCLWNETWDARQCQVNPETRISPDPETPRKPESGPKADDPQPETKPEAHVRPQKPKMSKAA